MHIFTLEDLKNALDIVKGKYQNATECYRKHLEIAEELQDKCGVGRAYANLGKCLREHW